MSRMSIIMFWIYVCPWARELLYQLKARAQQMAWQTATACQLENQP
jgi:hypothetical protein